MELLHNYQAEFWFAFGVILLLIELLVLGLSGALLFGGIGGIITGLLMFAGVVPEKWLWGFGVFALSSVLSAALLWKPLLKIQGEDSAPPRDTSSDLIGYEFILKESISEMTEGKIQYSGIEWRVLVDDESTITSIEAGTKVKVSFVAAGIFRVVPSSVP